MATQIYKVNRAELGYVLAEHVAKISTEAIKQRNKFTVALSGGSLPKFLEQLDNVVPESAWSHWYVFFADERVVPITHADSNFMACHGILSKIPKNQIFPLPVDIDEDLDDAPLLANKYEVSIRAICDDVDAVGMPVFDLVLLGMGPDGHTASLFPQHPLSYSTRNQSIQPKETFSEETVNLFDGKCVAYLTDSPKSPSTRITLTLDAINASRSVMFVATGASKADVLSECFSLNETFGQLQPDASSHYPCTFVRPIRPVATSAADGDNSVNEELPSLIWYLDDDAAAKLPPDIRSSSGFIDLSAVVPFFVYGTLMRGFGNHKVISPFLHQVFVAEIKHAKLLHFGNAGFPGIYPSDELSRVQGELVFIKPELYDQAMEALDGLEGYIGEGNTENLYNRVVVDVETKDSGRYRAHSYWCNVSEEVTTKDWGGVLVGDADAPGAVSWRSFMESEKLESAGANWHDQVMSKS